MLDPRDLGAHCPECPFNGRRPIFAAPSENRRLVIVGQGPGKMEEVKGQPFVGPSGKLLDHLLTSSGIRRGDCFVTNATLCRPENEEDKKAIEKAAQCCAPRLAGEIAKHPGAPIVTLGAHGLKTILGHVKGSIYAARGFVWTTPEIDKKKLAAAKRKGEGPKVWADEARATWAGRQCIPTLHPAFILRGADAWLPVMRVDFRRIKKLLDGTLTLEDQVPYVVCSTPETAARELATLGPLVSLDLETSRAEAYNAEIQCVGLSDNVKQVIIYPWSRAMRAPLREALRDRTVVTHNGPQFDHIVLAREKVVDV